MFAEIILLIAMLTPVGKVAAVVGILAAICLILLCWRERRDAQRDVPDEPDDDISSESRDDVETPAEIEDRDQVSDDDQAGSLFKTFKPTKPESVDEEKESSDSDYRYE